LTIDRRSAPKMSTIGSSPHATVLSILESVSPSCTAHRPVRGVESRAGEIGATSYHVASIRLMVASGRPSALRSLVQVSPLVDGHHEGLRGGAGDGETASPRTDAAKAVRTRPRR
jgi:hypothetical protein